MEKQNISKTAKAGLSTYFFDLKETKDSKPFLVFTQSRFMGEGKARERSRVMLFPDPAQEFLETFNDLVKELIKRPSE